MKRRLLGLFGIVGSLILANLAWVYLSGGEGIMRNVWRNGALGALLPSLLYSLYLLFGDTPNQGVEKDGQTP